MTLLALFGCIAAVAPRLIQTSVERSHWDSTLFPFYELLGLSVAGLISLVFLAYPLWRLMRDPVPCRRIARWAAFASLGLAALIGVAGFLFKRLVPGRSASFEAWEIALSLVMFVTVSMLSTFLIRAPIGPGRGPGAAP